MNRLLGLLGILALGLLQPAAAQAELRIGVVDDQPPCSDWDKGSFRGSAVDIWEEVASKANLKYSFVVLPPIPDKAVDAAKAGQVDLAVSCLNITKERLKKVDFTTPYAEDALTLVSLRKNSKFSTVISRLIASEIIRDSIGLLFILSLGFALIIWTPSRDYQRRNMGSDNKLHTFYKGWMLLAMGAGVDKMGIAPPSMTIIALSNIARLVITSIFVAATTKVLIEVAKPVDLSDAVELRSALEQKIAVNAHSVAQAWLEYSAGKLFSAEDRRKLIVPVEGVKALLTSLNQGKVDAILADRSIVSLIMSEAANAKDYVIIGQTLYSTPQAFVVGPQLDENTYRSINLALAELKFKGAVDRIIERWQPARRN